MTRRYCPNGLSRNVVLGARVDHAEHVKIMAAASQLGLSLSDYARAALLEKAAATLALSLTKSRPPSVKQISQSV